MKKRKKGLYTASVCCNGLGLHVFLVFILTFFCASQGNLYAQKMHLKDSLKNISTTIRGIVKDAGTKEPLDNCSVTIINTSAGTNTDMEGRFKVVIPANIPSAKLIITYIGYKADTIDVRASNIFYEIFLSSRQDVLNKVVITTFTGEQLLKEDPGPVKIVSAKAIEQTTESNIIDVLVRNVPGMSAVKTGPNVSKPFIHGLGYNRIETTFDGVPVEGQQFEDEEVLPVDMYNIERAEVILGPVCLMDGPDALGGLVSLIPSMPKDIDKIIHGRFFSEYQSNNGLVGNALRLTYGNGHWAFAVRGAYRIAKNYTNNIDRRVYNTGFREANASATILHSSSKGYTNFNFTLYDNLQGIPDGSRDSLTRKFTKAIYEDPQDDITNRPVVPDDELNSYKLSPIHQHIQHYRVYTNNHYSLGNGSVLDAMLSFQQNVRREYDFPIHTNQAGVSLRLNSLNYDIRYHLPEISNIEAVAGINGMYQTNKNVDANDIPIPDYRLLDIGSFIFAKWKHGNWGISGGIGYNSRHVTGNDFYARQDTSTMLTKHVFFPDTAGANLLFPAFKKTFTGLFADLGITFQVNPQVAIKVNMARGSGAPHVSEFASNGLDASAHAYFIGKPDLIPEYSWQEDIGVIVNLRNMDASISIFNNNLEDYIYLVQLADANGNPIEIVPGNKTYQYQQGAAHLYGLESTLNLHPASLKGFSWSNYFSIVYGFNVGSQFRNKGVNGGYLPQIPPMKIFSTLVKDIKTKSKTIPLISLRAEADINAAQNRYLALNETETATPGYILLNAGANFSIHYTKKYIFHFQLVVNNILDKAYQSNLSRLKYFEYYSKSPNGHFGIYGMGRNISGKLILPF